MRLTTKRVARALRTGRGRYPDGDGLYLQVTAVGRGSWLLRYERAGKERMLGLGPIQTIGLAEARTRARTARQSLLDNIDPIDSRRAQKAQRALEQAKSMTFEQAARKFHSAHDGKWRNRRHAASGWARSSGMYSRTSAPCRSPPSTSAWCSSALNPIGRPRLRR